LPGAEIR